MVDFREFLAQLLLRPVLGGAKRDLNHYTSQIRVPMVKSFFNWFQNRYSAEIQLLHVNEKCGRELNEALILCPNGTDTFGILSVFIDVGDNHNEDFEPIIEGKANDTWCDVNMALPVMEFQEQGYKIRKIFA